MRSCVFFSVFFDDDKVRYSPGYLIRDEKSAFASGVTHVYSYVQGAMGRLLIVAAATVAAPWPTIFHYSVEKPMMAKRRLWR